MVKNFGQTGRKKDYIKIPKGIIPSREAPGDNNGFFEVLSKVVFNSGFLIKW